MLQSFNKFIQGWMANVVVGLIAVCFVFWGVENYLLGNNDGQTLAKVGDFKIKESQFQQNFLMAQQNSQQQLGVDQLSTEQLAELKQQT